MKNLPDKIYVHEISALELDVKIPNSVEYIRKDVFVEKACDWLEQTLEPYIPYCNIDIDLAIEGFKKYMEE